MYLSYRTNSCNTIFDWVEYAWNNLCTYAIGQILDWVEYAWNNLYTYSIEQFIVKAF